MVSHDRRCTVAVLALLVALATVDARFVVESMQSADFTVTPDATTPFLYQAGPSPASNPFNLTVEPGSVRLTRGVAGGVTQGQCAAMWHQGSERLDDNFAASFIYRASRTPKCAGCVFGGIAFVMSAVDVTAVGATRLGMTAAGAGFAGLPNTLAIRFLWEPYNERVEVFATGPGVPNFGNASSAIPFGAASLTTVANNVPVHIILTYDSINHTLALQRNGELVLTVALNITAALGLAGSSQGWVGVTAAGGTAALEDGFLDSFIFSAGCVPGHTGANCGPCGMGTYAAEIGQTICEPCPPGTIAPDSGATQCTPCPDGQATLDGITCAPCNVGSFYNTTVSLCMPCSSPYVTLSPGAIACDLCPANTYYATPSSCVACPQNAVSTNRLAVGQDACGCLLSYFMEPNTFQCSLCPDHALCPGGRELPQSKPAYWASQINASAMIECPLPGGCAGGNMCVEGYNGTLCAACSNGWYQVGNACFQCDDEAVKLALLILFSLFVLLVLLPFLYVVKDYLRAMITVYTFIQTMGLLASVNVNWPSAFVVMLRFYQALSLDVRAIGFIKCQRSVEKGYFSSWLLAESVPLVLMAFIVACMLLRLFMALFCSMPCGPCKRWNDPSKPKRDVRGRIMNRRGSRASFSGRSDDEQGGPVYRVLQRRDPNALTWDNIKRKMRQTTCKDECGSFVKGWIKVMKSGGEMMFIRRGYGCRSMWNDEGFVWLLTMLVIVISLLVPLFGPKAFEPLACSELSDGSFVLTADNSLGCDLWDAREQGLIGMMGTLYMVLFVGYLVLIAYLVNKDYKKEKREKALWWHVAFDAVFDGYGKDFMWWSIIDVIRRFLLSLFFTFFRQARTQLYAAVVSTFVSLVLHLIARPFHMKEQTDLETTVLAGSQAVLLFALLSTAGVQSTLLDVSMWLCIAITLVALVWVLFKATIGAQFEIKGDSRDQPFPRIKEDVVSHLLASVDEAEHDNFREWCGSRSGYQLAGVLLMNNKIQYWGQKRAVRRRMAPSRTVTQDGSISVHQDLAQVGLDPRQIEAGQVPAGAGPVYEEGAAEEYAPEPDEAPPVAVAEGAYAVPAPGPDPSAMGDPPPLLQRPSRTGVPRSSWASSPAHTGV